MAPASLRATSAQAPTPPLFDTILEVRDGGCLGAAVAGSCNDDVRTGQIRCSVSTSTLRSNGAGDGLWFALVDGCGQQSPPNADGGYELHLSVAP